MVHALNGREQPHAVQHSRLFDDLIGAQHKLGWEFILDRLRGPKVDD
jgi:hypothetical protein